MARLTLPQWLSRMTRPSQRVRRRSGPPTRHRSRPHLEPLEGRCLPSGFNFTTIDPPGASFAGAFGINDSGQIVGAFGIGSTNHGFMLSGGNYRTLDPPGATFTSATGINDTGQVVGYYRDSADNLRGFLLSGGSYTTIDVPGSNLTEAFGINARGEIVGSYGLGGTLHGFLLSSDNYSTFDVPGSSFTQALGIDASGQIVGEYGVGPQIHGFLLEGGRYTTIDFPGASQTHALGINDQGQIVGEYVAGGLFHGFLLEGGAYTTIDVPGATQTGIFGINPAGQIVGFYVDAGGGNHGFLATPVVPPSVTCSVADSQLWPPTQQLVNVGLGVSASPPGATLQVQVYADDNASAADAAAIAPDSLQLRAARQENGSGRVYLIVVTATAGGQTAFDVCTVVVPHDQSGGSLAQVQADAAAAEAYYREFQTAPSGFHLLGEGPTDAGVTATPAVAAGIGAGFRLAPATVVSLLSAPSQSPIPSTTPATSLTGNVPAGGPAAPVDGYFATATEGASRFTLLGPEEEGGGEVGIWVPDLWLSDRLFA